MEKLCVIFGGASCEHDVSIITGMQLAQNLKEKYTIEKIYLSLDNKFYLASGVTDVSYFNNKSNIKLPEIYFVGNEMFTKGKIFSKNLGTVKCMINCCHGGVGENGDLSSFFEIHKIPHTTSNSLSCKIAMDKSLAKRFVSDIGIETVKGIKIDAINKEFAINQIKSDFQDSLIVKPNALGSSIGLKSCTKEDFENQVDAIFEMEDDALVEEKIENMKEFNQACFYDNGRLILSAIEEPISKTGILTFDDKYCNKQKGKCNDRIIPAVIDKDLEDKINEYTQKIYSHLKFNGVVRIDYIFDTQSKVLYFNEANTIPGSMAFYLYSYKGLDYISLIERLIQNSTVSKKYSYFNTPLLTKNLL